MSRFAKSLFSSFSSFKRHHGRGEEERIRDARREQKNKKKIGAALMWKRNYYQTQKVFRKINDINGFMWQIGRYIFLFSLDLFTRRKKKLYRPERYIRFIGKTYIRFINAFLRRRYFPGTFAFRPR